MSVPLVRFFLQKKFAAMVHDQTESIEITTQNIVRILESHNHRRLSAIYISSRPTSDIEFNPRTYTADSQGRTDPLSGSSQANRDSPAFEAICKPSSPKQANKKVKRRTTPRSAAYSADKLPKDSANRHSRDHKSQRLRSRTSTTKSSQRESSPGRGLGVDLDHSDIRQPKPSRQLQTLQRPANNFISPDVTMRAILVPAVCSGPTAAAHPHGGGASVRLGAASGMLRAFGRLLDCFDRRRLAAS